MKKIAVLSLLLAVVLLLNTTTVQAGKRPPTQPVIATPGFSWFGTYGYTGYPGLLNGFVYASEMNYPISEVGFYTISGQAFVGQSPTVTHISGSCFTQKDVQMDFSAILTVDGIYSVPLFFTHVPTSYVGVFDVTARGQSFVIKINTIAPLGCNILLESK